MKSENNNKKIEVNNLNTNELKCQGVYHEAVVQFTFLKLDADTFVIKAHKQFAVKKNQIKIMKGVFYK